MYIVHDRMIDKYLIYTTLQALSDKEKIPYGTLANVFSRPPYLDRYVTKDAVIIIKTDPVHNTRKRKK